MCRVQEGQPVQLVSSTIACLLVESCWYSAFSIFSPGYNEDSWLYPSIFLTLVAATFCNDPWTRLIHRGWLQGWWTVPWASAGRPSNSRLGFSRMAGKFMDFLDDYDFTWFYKVMIHDDHDDHDDHVWRACLKKGSMTCLKGSRVSSNGSSMTCLLPSSRSCFLRWGDTSCSWAVTWTAQSGRLTWCVVIGLRGTGTYRAKTTEILYITCHLIS